MTQIQALTNAMAVLNYMLTYYPTHITAFESNGVTYFVSIQEAMTEDEAERIKKKIKHIAQAGTEIRINQIGIEEYYSIDLTWRYNKTNEEE